MVASGYGWLFIAVGGAGMLIVRFTYRHRKSPHRSSKEFVRRYGIGIVKVVRQQYLHADDFIPKLGNDLWKVVECQFDVLHMIR